ncbi:hypothetical protein JCM17960_03870 [Magnetospira thiophila]
MRIATHRGLRHVVCLSALWVLTGCSSLFDKPERQYCAGVSVPMDLADMVIFEGAGRDLIDVNYGGHIRDVDTSCVFDIHKKTKEGTMKLLVAPMIEVERGNANKDGKAALSYFIAITESGQSVRDKQIYSFTSEFPGNVSRMVVKDKPVSIEVPVGPKKGGTSYHVYVGFQLDQAQVDFNRKRLKQVR